MLLIKLMDACVDILFALFVVCLFFMYFSLFFQRKKRKCFVVFGIGVLLVWQLGGHILLRTLSMEWNICVSLGVTLFAAVSIFSGKIWLKCFFTIIFDAVWMLVETLTGSLLMIYGGNIIELQTFGSLISKFFLFCIILVLRKVFVNGNNRELPVHYSIFMLLIPIGSIYIMNAMFILSYRSHWEYAEIYSFVSAGILLFLNILIFYIYIKLADDVQVRRMNIIYAQQLDLCERHQKETEFSTLKMRDVRHGIKSYFLSIRAYAEKEECEKIICFVNDVMEEGVVKESWTVNTGNIVIDSLVGYWKKEAVDRGIEFREELDIPMEIPFRGADVSLILGNLLENAVEAAEKVERGKYIRLKIKYDKKNLLFMVENNYKGDLRRDKSNELKTTKADAMNHGIGISSVRRITERYHGTVAIDSTIPGRFVIRVVLYGL